jgi:hypothetical protein
MFRATILVRALASTPSSAFGTFSPVTGEKGSRLLEAAENSK